MKLLLMTSAMLMLSGAAGGAAPVSPTTAQVGIPVPFAAEYRLMRDGMHIADAHFVLSRDDEDGWIFQSETKPAGVAALLLSDVIVERSSFRMGAEHPIPLSYRYEHRGSSKDHDAHYAFDWQREHIDGVYRGKPVDVALTRGTLDPLTLRLAVGLDLARGALPTEYSVIERRQVKQYLLTALTPLRIRVPAGEYDVQGVARASDDGTKTTRFLYAPALDWAPVLMEQSETDEATYRLELVKFSSR